MKNLDIIIHVTPLFKHLYDPDLGHSQRLETTDLNKNHTYSHYKNHRVNLTNFCCFVLK